MAVAPCHSERGERRIDLVALREVVDSVFKFDKHGLLGCRRGSRLDSDRIGVEEPEGPILQEASAVELSLLYDLLAVSTPLEEEHLDIVREHIDAYGDPVSDAAYQGLGMCLDEDDRAHTGIASGLNDRDEEVAKPCLESGVEVKLRLLDGENERG